MNSFLLSQHEGGEDTYVHDNRLNDPIGRVELVATADDELYPFGAFDAWVATNSTRSLYTYCGRYTNIITAARDIVTAYHAFTDAS